MFSFIDNAAFGLLNGYVRHPVLDFVLPIFLDARFLWLGLIVFLGCFVIYCRRRYGEALWRVLVLMIFMGLSAGAADMSCNAIKDAVGRYRPFQSVEGTNFMTPEGDWTVIEYPMHFPGTTGGSFPSSHAATSMAIAVVLSLLFRPANPWIFALPLLVGWSRVYVGKHFPFDVLMGWLVGFIAVLIVWGGCHLLVTLLSPKRKPIP